LRDVKSVIFGWALPSEIRAHIRDVSETSIVRKNYVARFDISVDGNKATINVSESWDVYNFSTHAQKYKSSYAVDLHDDPDFDAASCESAFGNAKSRLWDSKSLNAAKHIKRESGSVTWEIDSVTLPPQEVSDKDLKPSGRVCWRCKLRTPIDYSNVITFRT